MHHVLGPRSLLGALAASLALACGCGASDGGASPAGAGDAASPPPTTFGGDRPATLRVPAGYDPSRPAPLVVLLHGYGASGAVQEAYFHLGSIADAEGYFLIAPDGTFDATGKRFWNVAVQWCASPEQLVDDVGYVTSLVAEISAGYAIDPRRVFVVGHSNGGAMAHLLACVAADRFAAIASLAGPMAADASSCAPSQPVGVLHVAGTGDTTIDYDGGTRELAGSDAPCAYAGAVATVDAWAEKNGCSAEVDEGAAPFDLDVSLPGSETTVRRHAGCPARAAAELWSIAGGEHIPSLAPDFPSRVWAFLAAHARE